MLNRLALLIILKLILEPSITIALDLSPLSIPSTVAKKSKEQKGNPSILRGNFKELKEGEVELIKGGNIVFTATIAPNGFFQFTGYFEPGTYTLEVRGNKSCKNEFVFPLRDDLVVNC